MDGMAILRIEDRIDSMIAQAVIRRSTQLREHELDYLARRVAKRVWEGFS